LDQRLISGSHFAVSILLAPWLAPSEYAAYALAIAAYLLLEPMSVFGPARYAQCLRAHPRKLTGLHVVLPPLPITLLGAGVALTSAVRRRPRPYCGNPTLTI
jgi:hypothetical protein